MNKYSYNDNTFETKEDLINFLIASGIVKEIKEEVKLVEDTDSDQWSYEKLVEAAKQHFAIYEKSYPCTEDEIMKGALKMWRAGHLAIKEVFLKIGINIVSDDSVKQIWDLVDKNEKYFSGGLSCAKRFENFALQGRGFHPEDFGDIIDLFESYIACFMEMPIDVQSNIRKLIDLNENVHSQQENGSVETGKKTYHYDLTVL